MKGEEVLLNIITVLANAEPVTCAIITSGLVICYAFKCMSKQNENQ